MAKKKIEEEVVDSQAIETIAPSTGGSLVKMVALKSILVGGTPYAKGQCFEILSGYVPALKGLAKVVCEDGCKDCEDCIEKQSKDSNTGNVKKTNKKNPNCKNC